MDGSDDEWEEHTVVVELNGVLDAQNVRDAVSRGQVALRRGATDTPILQVGNSLYSGKWSRNVGSDIILKEDGGNNLQVCAVTDRKLITEKALLTAATSKEDAVTKKLILLAGARVLNADDTRIFLICMERAHCIHWRCMYV